ncbi:MAG: molybdopterin-dependent oxidoreductase [Actinobacteria bacterium]|nr:molybdopterin-dependent oxidoreductase [Actinomycetota bacterium]
MDEPSTAEESTPPSNRRVAGTRRSFLRWAGIAAAGTAVVATGAKALSSGGSGGGSAVAANTSPLPNPVATLPPQLRSLASTPNLNIEGITPLMTPNDDFFRIDTALSVPRVDLANWRLEIKGNVRTPFSISYDELLAMPQVEAPITLACVSNRVGGTLIGTAMWQGVELRTLLDRAGVEPSGEQIVGTSVDGYNAGFPTSAAFDGRSSLVAIGMNGVPLPLDNGFPARIVVEGLYGYVSSTKWLRSIELTEWDSFNGYWIQQGWAKNGPIKMSSRIDVPRSGARQPEGIVTLAGVAWAPNTGVAAVEVRIDGVWRRATLGDSLSGGVWRQWYYDWNATKGEHEIAVRCIDADGQVQTGEITPNPIAGYTGWETRSITIV